MVTNFQFENPGDRKSTRLNSSHVENSYAVFCLKKKNPSAWCELDHIRHVGGLAAGEDVGLDTALAEGPTQLADVHVHPARLPAAERRERTGVGAQNRHSQRHRLTILVALCTTQAGHAGFPRGRDRWLQLDFRIPARLSPRPRQGYEQQLA